MASGGEQTALFVRLMTILVPLGLYFLLLGVLNSRRHPQLLSGRKDFVLLLAAFAPMLVLPVLNVLAVPLPAGAAVLGGVLAAAAIAGPGAGRWVIYNLPADQARRVVRLALDALGVGYQEQPGGFLADDRRLSVQISSFPLLRNVSVHMDGPDKDLRRQVAQAMADQLLTCRAQTYPATVALMLTAIGMMVAPMVLVAHRAGDIVRILVDLLP